LTFTFFSYFYFLLVLFFLFILSFIFPFFLNFCNGDNMAHNKWEKVTVQKAVNPN
jgi:hypothetical protein